MVPSISFDIKLHQVIETMNIKLIDMDRIQIICTPSDCFSAAPTIMQNAGWVRFFSTHTQNVPKHVEEVCPSFAAHPVEEPPSHHKHILLSRFLVDKTGPGSYPSRSHFSRQLRMIGFEFRWRFRIAHNHRVHSTVNDAHQDAAKDIPNNKSNTVNEL